MILHRPDKLNFDLIDDSFDFLAFTFYLKGTLSYRDYGKPVWKALANTLQNTGFGKNANLVVLSGIYYNEDSPVAFQMGFFGDGEEKFWRKLEEEFAGVEGFQAIEEAYFPEDFLDIRYRIYKEKIFAYNNLFDHKLYQRNDLNLPVVSRSLFLSANLSIAKN